MTVSFDAIGCAADVCHRVQSVDLDPKQAGDLSEDVLADLSEAERSSSSPVKIKFAEHN